MQDSLVSIIMPVYNGAEFIEEAIRSVINQTYYNWELIIVNDGSTDSTRQCIKGFSDERICYLEQENKGVSSARNLGLKNMQGSYYCFLDADDVLPANSLQSRMKVFRSSGSGVQYVDGKVKIFNESPISKIKFWEPNFSGNPYSELLQLRANCFFGPTWLIKRSEHNIYFREDLTHGEDLFYFMELARCGGLYSHTDEVVLNYRTGNRSAMSDYNGLERGHLKMLSILNKDKTIPFSIKLKRKLKVLKVLSLISFSNREYVRPLILARRILSL